MKGVKPPNAGKGRKPGQTNKLTRELKAMIEGALQDAGGQAYLATQAKEEPAAFLALLGKCLPRDVNLGGGLKLSVNLVSDNSVARNG
jgi:hypothetical protein